MINSHSGGFPELRKSAAASRSAPLSDVAKIMVAGF
jgi:hypothetical protein